MKILQLCHKAPFPPKDGGCIAMNNLTQGLSDWGHEIKVLAISTPKHKIDIAELPADYINKTNFESVFIDTTVKAISAFLNLFSNKSYNIERFYSMEMEQKLIVVLKGGEFDIIQLESLFVCRYIDTIRKHSNAKIVLRAHNVEHLIWERNAASEKNPVKKWYLNLLAKRLKNFELSIPEKLDAIACITKEDETYFKKQGVIKSIDSFAFGIDLKAIKTDTSQEEYPSLFHIGAMDWMPNTEGIRWFLENVWLKVQQKYPHLKLYLAGKNMPDWVQQLKLINVVVEGEVENAHDFIRSKAVMIVPLLSGGGMRVKIIEGMALGKTIVSTAVGAEGISCTDNKDILIANDADAFAEKISRCVSDKTFYDAIGKNAKSLIEKQYNNIDICKRLTDFYRQLNNQEA